MGYQPQSHSPFDLCFTPDCLEPRLFRARLVNRKIQSFFGGRKLHSRQQHTRAMNAYHSYKNLPSLAGLCSMEDAMKPGLSVEECVARLKRYHYVFKRLHQIFNNRITSEPIYELKMAF